MKRLRRLYRKLRTSLTSIDRKEYALFTSCFSQGVRAGWKMAEIPLSYQVMQIRGVIKVGAAV